MCLKLFRKGENEMQYTDNLDLNLPEDEDAIENTSREAWNDNFEVIDSNIVIKGDFAIMSGNVTLTNGTGSVDINYPTGFSQANCVVMSAGMAYMGSNYGYGIANGAFAVGAELKAESVKLYVKNLVEAQVSVTKPVKVVLMKNPT